MCQRTIVGVALKRRGPLESLVHGKRACHGSGEGGWKRAGARRDLAGRLSYSTAPPVTSAFSAEEDDKTVRLIQEMEPDMLFVAFGAPRQDEWIRTHMQRLNVPVCMGVGGAFDMVAGRVRRAPGWMQQAGLEWAYRLVQEPTRLWKRYFVDDLPIFLRLMAQRRTGTSVAHTVTGLLAGSEVLAPEPAVASVASDIAIAQESGFHVA